MSKILNYFYNSIKKIDIFGVFIAFDYEGKKKYKTFLGGIIFLTFSILVLTNLLINFSTLLQRDSMSFIYYKLKLSKPDTISLKNYTSILAYQLICDDYTVEEVNKFFTFKQYFTVAKKDPVKRPKVRKKLNTHICSEKDFYNEFNSSMNDLNLKEYFCLETEQTAIEGAYPNEDWAYYEIRLITKENLTEEEENKAMEILTEKECKLHTYFLEERINIHSFSSPREKYVNADYTIVSADSLYNRILKR